MRGGIITLSNNGGWFLAMDGNFNIDGKDRLEDLHVGMFWPVGNFFKGPSLYINKVEIFDSYENAETEMVKRCLNIKHPVTDN